MANDNKARRMLYDGLVKDKMYSKSYDEFCTQFGDKKTRAKLYNGLVEDKLYSKSAEEFDSQFFGDLDAVKAETQKAGGGEPGVKTREGAAAGPAGKTAGTVAADGEATGTVVQTESANGVGTRGGDVSGLMEIDDNARGAMKGYNDVARQWNEVVKANVNTGEKEGLAERKEVTRNTFAKRAEFLRRFDELYREDGKARYKGMKDASPAVVELMKDLRGREYASHDRKEYEVMDLRNVSDEELNRIYKYLEGEQKKAGETAKGKTGGAAKIEERPWYMNADPAAAQMSERTAAQLQKDTQENASENAMAVWNKALNHIGEEKFRRDHKEIAESTTTLRSEIATAKKNGGAGADLAFASQFAKDTEDILKGQSKYAAEKNTALQSVGKHFEGFYRGAVDTDNIPLYGGIQEAARYGEVARVALKKNDGEKLTENEKILLRSYMGYLYAQQQLESQFGKAYSSGLAAGESAAFMAEMVAFDAAIKASGKLAAKAGAKYLPRIIASMYGDYTANRMGQKVAIKGVENAVGRFGAQVGGAAVQTALQASTYANLERDRARAAQDGREFGVREIAGSIGNSFIEVMSEQAFNGINGWALGHTYRYLDDIGLKFFGKLEDMNKFMRYSSQVLRSQPEEYMEEYEGAGLKMGLGYLLGDEKMMDDARRTFTSEGTADMFLSFMLPGAIAGGAYRGIAMAKSHRFDKKRNELAGALMGSDMSYGDAMRQLQYTEQSGDATEFTRRAQALHQRVMQNELGNGVGFEAAREKADRLVNGYADAMSEYNENMLYTLQEWDKMSEEEKTAAKVSLEGVMARIGNREVDSEIAEEVGKKYGVDMEEVLARPAGEAAGTVAAGSTQMQETEGVATPEVKQKAFAEYAQKLIEKEIIDGKIAEEAAVIDEKTDENGNVRVVSVDGKECTVVSDDGQTIVVRDENGKKGQVASSSATEVSVKSAEEAKQEMAAEMRDKVGKMAEFKPGMAMTMEDGRAGVIVDQRDEGVVVRRPRTKKEGRKGEDGSTYVEEVIPWSELGGNRQLLEILPGQIIGGMEVRNVTYREDGARVWFEGLDTPMTLPYLEEMLESQGLSLGGELKANADGTAVKKSDEELAAQRAELEKEIVGEAEALCKRLGVEVHIARNADEIESATARKKAKEGKRVKGWYVKSTGVVEIYLPYAESVEDVRQTIFHEVVAHKGLRDMFGEKYDELCARVWEGMDEEDQERFLEYVRKSTGVEDEAQVQLMAADEYMAYMAEKVAVMDEVEKSKWQRLCETITEFLNGLFGGNARVGDAEIVGLIERSERMMAEKAAEGKGKKGKKENVKLELAERDKDGDELPDNLKRLFKRIVDWSETLGVDLGEIDYSMTDYEHKSIYFTCGLIASLDDNGKMILIYNNHNKNYHNSELKTALTKYLVDIYNQHRSQKLSEKEGCAYIEGDGIGEILLFIKWSDEKLNNSTDREIFSEWYKVKHPNEAYEKGKTIEKRHKKTGKEKALSSADWKKIIPKEDTRPMMMGVYHDKNEKVAVATDTHKLVVSEESYEKENAGESIEVKSGKPIEGRFPRWWGLITNSEKPTAIDINKFKEAVNTFIAESKKYYSKSAALKKAVEQWGSKMCIDFGDGKTVAFELKTIADILSLSDKLGLKSVDINTAEPGTHQVIFKGTGKNMALVMPITPLINSEYSMVYNGNSNEIESMNFVPKGAMERSVKGSEERYRNKWAGELVKEDLGEELFEKARRGDVAFREDVENEEGAVMYREVEDEELIAWFNEQPKVITFKTVSKSEDGGMDAPMASSVKSSVADVPYKTKEGKEKKGRQIVKTGRFEFEKLLQAEENANLIKRVKKGRYYIDEEGNVVLLKPNEKAEGRDVKEYVYGEIDIVRSDGKSLTVAYDPYDHSSDSMINDQFKSAWERDDLVVIRQEIAQGDLNEHYWSENAMLPTGRHNWKKGVLGTKMQDDDARHVYLARYSRPLGEVSWEEVADEWIKKCKKYDLDVPFNVVPKAIRNMLADAGIKIVEPEKGMGKNCFDAYEEWKKERDGVKLKDGSVFRRNGEGAEIETPDGVVFRIDVFHGSSKYFENFDHKFMGSGEGSQAFGWGTYVSAVENIARGYAEIAHKRNYNNDGIRFTKNGIIISDRYLDYNASYDEHRVMNMIRGNRGDISLTIKEIQEHIDYCTEKIELIKSRLSDKNATLSEESYARGYERLKEFEDELNEYRNRLRIAKDIESGKSEIKLINNSDVKRYLYNVKIPDDNAPKTVEQIVSDLLGEFDGNWYFLDSSNKVQLDMGQIFEEYASEELTRWYNSLHPDNQITEDDLINELQSKPGSQSVVGDNLIKDLYDLNEAIANEIEQAPKDEVPTYLSWDTMNGNTERIVNKIMDYVEDAADITASDMKAYNQLCSEGLKGRMMGGRLYDLLSKAFGSDRTASEILSAIGMKGVKVSTGYAHTGQTRDTKNYVIFDAADAEIVGNVAFREEIESADPFLSNAAVAVEGIKQEKASGEQWINMLKNNGGLKAEEDKWIGLSEWLSGKKSVTKDEVKAYIAENAVRVEDVEYEENKQVSESSDITYESELEREFENLRVEYGAEESFRKMCERHPGLEEWAEIDVYYLEWKDLYNDDFDEWLQKDWGRIARPNYIHDTRLVYTTKGLENKREIALVVPTIEPYNENDEIHFGDAGGGRAVAWVRFGDAKNTDGKRVLVIDEIQSKRHQDGREKGYVGKINPADIELEFTNDGSNYVLARWNGWEEGVRRRFGSEEEARKYFARRFVESGMVPDAPFQKNWQELAMKRMLRYAAENGYDMVAWTTGTQQAERYQIGRQIRSIKRGGESMFGDKEIILDNYGRSLTILIDEGGIVVGGDFDNAIGNPLSAVIGKELAEKVMNLKEGEKIESEGLNVGGEGMRGFYDQMLPRFMDKYGKKWGVKTQDVELDLPREADRVMHGVEVNKAMRESVMGGQVMFREAEWDKMDDAQREIVEKAAEFNRRRPQYRVGRGNKDESVMQYFERYKAWREEVGDQYKAATGDELPEMPKYVRGAMTLTEYFNAYAKYEYEYDAVEAAAEWNKMMERANSNASWFVRVLFDRMHRLEVFYDSAKKAGLNVNTNNDAYSDVFRRQKRAQRAIEIFTKDHLLPMKKRNAYIVKLLKENGDWDFTWKLINDKDVKKYQHRREGKKVKAAELAYLYLQAKDIIEVEQIHLAILQQIADAEERRKEAAKAGNVEEVQKIANEIAALQKKGEGYADRGRKGFEVQLGAKPEEVVNYVEKAVGNDKGLDELWQSIRDVCNAAFDYMIDGGYASEEQKEAIIGGRQFYVPERGFAYNEHLDDTAMASPFERAEGRVSLAANPYIYLTEIVESAIQLTERNRTKQHMWNFLSDNRNWAYMQASGAAKMARVWTIRKFDDEGNFIGEELSFTAPTAEQTAHDTAIRQRIKEIQAEIDAMQVEKLNVREEEIEEINKKISIKIGDIYRLNQQKIVVSVVRNDLLKGQEILDKIRLGLFSDLTEEEWRELASGAIARANNEKTKNDVLKNIVKVNVNGESYLMWFNDENLATVLNGAKEWEWVQGKDNTRSEREAKSRRRILDRKKMTPGDMLLELGLIPAKVTRKLSAFKTQYNWDFSWRNGGRDMQFAFIVNTIEHNPVFATKVTKNSIAMMPMIFRYLVEEEAFDSKKFKDADQRKRAIWIEEFMANGGETGYSFMQPANERQMKYKEEMKKMVKQLDKCKSAADVAKWMDEMQKNRTIRQNIEHFAEFASQWSELSTRLGQYVTERTDGKKSPKEAALSAKEITTNFNRQGELASIMGPFYMFYNATLQGTYRIYRSVYKDGELQKKNLAKLLAVKAGYVLFGMFQKLANPDDPDEETFVPDYMWKTYMKIGDLYLPTPHYFRADYYLGSCIASCIMGEKSVGEAIFDAMTYHLEELVPGNFALTSALTWDEKKKATGNGRLDFDWRMAIRNLMPIANYSFVQPLTDIMVNRNYLGAPVYKKPYINDDAPLNDVHMGFSSTPDYVVRLCGAIQDATGKMQEAMTGVPYSGWQDKYETKGLDINPTIPYYLIKQYGGGVFDLVFKIGAMPFMFTADGMEARNIPFVGSIYKPYERDRMTTQYYWDIENVNTGWVKEFDSAHRAKRKGGDPKKYEYMKESRYNELHKRWNSGEFRKIKNKVESNVTLEDEELEKLIEFRKEWYEE